MAPNRDIFPAKRGTLFLTIMALIIVSLAIFIWSTWDQIQLTPWILLPSIPAIGLLLWVYFDTSYAIEGRFFIYRSGFLRGRISISSIREVTSGTTLWVGVRPALARGGIIIRYGKFDEIYVAPKGNAALIRALQEVNPKIVVRD